MEQWDLFETRPLAIVRHPVIGERIPVAAVTKSKKYEGVWYFPWACVSTAYPGGLPTSGHASYFVEGAPEYDEAAGMWRLNDPDTGLYKFTKCNKSELA